MGYRALNEKPRHYAAHWAPVLIRKGGEWVVKMRGKRKFRQPLSSWARMALALAHKHADKLNSADVARHRLGL